MNHIAKYKHLRGGVQSFTEGFTGIINIAFSLLAFYATRTQTASFHFDHLARTSIPPIPDTEEWSESLFSYIDPRSWLPRIGVAPEHVVSFTTDIHFDLSSLRTKDFGTSREDFLDYEARTEIIDDREQNYSCVRRAATFFNDRNA